MFDFFHFEFPISNFGFSLPKGFPPGCGWAEVAAGATDYQYSMPVQFETIKVGTKWDRKRLASLWGYKTFHALARGVVTPSKDNKIILFVTEDKQYGLTQYADRLLDKTLEWEGEDGHANDRRIVGAEVKGDEIHIFYRERHHADFIYLGKGTLKSHTLLTERPSKFVFVLGHWD